MPALLELTRTRPLARVLLAAALLATSAPAQSAPARPATAPWNRKS